MKIQLKNENLSWKLFTTLVLIIAYWFYLSICFGYFLAKIFYCFFDGINKPNLYKIIKFRKKFSFKNLKKIIINSILKFFSDWIKRIVEKLSLTWEATNDVITILRICSRKFKSILKFKRNFRMLRILLPTF